MPIPAFPAAVRQLNCKTYLHIFSSGNCCKTNFYFHPLRVEVNFALQLFYISVREMQEVLEKYNEFLYNKMQSERMEQKL